MNDLFEREQAILEEARSYLENGDSAAPCQRERYALLVREYERILKLARRVTRVTDKTATELNADKIKLLNKIHYDVLTGIYNRRYFEDELVDVMRTCRETGAALGLLMLDVDFFKLYNDTYGHGQGDDCLREIAQTLSKTLSEHSGFAARYGGEEFVAVLPGLDEAALGRVAEQILQSILALGIPHEKNKDWGLVTLSIGGTSIPFVVEEDKSSYLRCADEALYQSKRSGRARYTLWSFKEDEHDY